MKTMLALVAALLTSLAAAQNNPANAPRPEPILPPGAGGDAGLEPEVTIRADGEDRVEEYRVRGRLYMVKVTPKIGKPYYLVDQRGDGLLTRYDGPGADLKVPMWLITSW